MKPVRWTAHAERTLVDREIDRAEATRALLSPEAEQSVRPPRKAYMRRYFDPALEQTMLLRVIAEETLTEIVVITLYKTSQVAKYMKGGTP